MEVPEKKQIKNAWLVCEPFEQIMFVVFSMKIHHLSKKVSTN